HYPRLPTPILRSRPRHPPRPPPFPYTTLFRSQDRPALPARASGRYTLVPMPVDSNPPADDAAILEAVDRFKDRGIVGGRVGIDRSEEHTSELQSRENLVCRLLLEKKKKWTCQC